MDRSLHGLPPIRRSKGPHSASFHTRRDTNSPSYTQNSKNRKELKYILSIHVCLACTHMFPCNGANVIDVFNLSLVLDHPYSNWIITNLWGNVALDLKAQVFEHQISWNDVKVNEIKGTIRNAHILPVQHSSSLTVFRWFIYLWECLIGGLNTFLCFLTDFQLVFKPKTGG